MADKKTYSAQEAAIAVLAKAEQMLKNSSLMKAQNMSRPHKEDASKENEIGTKFQKAENKTAPSNSQKPRIEEKGTERDYKNFETQPGNAPENDHRQAEQTPPGNNPHEKAEGNNPDWGTDPGVKGHIKLAHFMGHRSAKKKQQSASGTVPAQGANLEKSANPDEKADAELGEEVEHLTEKHMLDNKAAEKKEGHKIVKNEGNGGEITPGKMKKGICLS